MIYVSNNESTITTDVGRFLIEQRNVGFEPNDGKWIVSQLPELYWSQDGFLRQERPGLFLGTFDTRADAYAAIESAEIQPVKDELVRSMGFAY